MSIFSYIIWLGILLALASRFIQTLPSDQRDVAQYGFWGHALAAPALIFVALTFLNGGGDLNVYQRVGGDFASYLYTDFGRWAGEFFKLSFRVHGETPFNAHGIGTASSTGAMFAISTWLMFISGKSFYGACLIVAIMNFASRIAIFLAFREKLPREVHRLTLLCCVAVPSGIFWTAGLFKEGIAMTGFGWCIYGISRIAVKNQWIRGILIFVIGAIPIYAVKVYILIPLVIGGSVWIAAEAALARTDGGQLKIRPIYFILGIGVGLLGMYVLGIVAPQYSFGAVSDELIGLQTVGQRIGGNTNYSLGQVSAGMGMQGQLALAPIALFFAVARPFFFEATSAQVLVNAIESTILTYFLFKLFFVTKPASIFAQTLRTPLLLFVVVFVALFGTAVGLGSTNVGSLSRYRAPMMPLYAVFLFVLPKLVEMRAKVPEQQAVQIPTQETAAQRRRRIRLGQRATQAANRLSVREQRVAKMRDRLSKTPRRVRQRSASRGFGPPVHDSGE